MHAVVLHFYPESLRESDGQNKDLNRSVQELTAIRVQLQGERDGLLSELGDARDSVKDLQVRFDASNSQLNQLRIDVENRLREKDEELENTRLDDVDKAATKKYLEITASKMDFSNSC